MKEKLIHTDLLSKYGHNSASGIATASHLEYCRWRYKQTKEDFFKDFSAYLEYFYEFFNNFVSIILIPLAFFYKRVYFLSYLDISS